MEATEAKVIKRTLRIGGMSCVNCQNRIEKKLRNTPGVEEAAVNYHTGTATVTYNAALVSPEEIRGAIETLDYQVLGEKQRSSPLATVGVLVIMLALYILIRQFSQSGIAAAFPLAEAGMGYGMLFIIGLVTSVHCAAMCGGINLSQCLPPGAGAGGGMGVLRPSLLYNGGRVLSYTLVGAAVGGLGSVVSFSGPMEGVVQLIAGLFMVVMGLNMLGVFPGLRRFSLRMPRFFARRIDAEREAGRNPLLVGLLNGLMPCGPLQAMQLYALSTGGPLRGALSMFLFSLGTTPLMFGLGALGSFLGKKGTARIMKGGAVLVTVLGLTMFSNGWNLSGFSGTFGFPGSRGTRPIPGTAGTVQTGSAPRAGSGAASGAAPFKPVLAGGAQIVKTTLSSGRYSPITVQVGIPVKWTIEAPPGSITGCNNRMILREYGIEHRFRTGENLIEFTPERTGKFTYSCWMGMIRSTITVVDAGAEVPGAQNPGAGNSAAENSPVENSAPIPAGVSIPTGTIALGEISDGRQQVRIRLGDNGFEPALLVLQRGLPAEWIITNDSLDEGNRALLFPAYAAVVPIELGNNLIRLIPAEDFDFSTVDNVYYGLVKVVEDLAGMDPELIKKEAAEFETLIYPDEYFEN
jgi:sulfite exporter TauE/SafE/copper chaperone CopZ